MVLMLLLPLPSQGSWQLIMFHGPSLCTCIGVDSFISDSVEPLDLGCRRLRALKGYMFIRG